MSLFLIHLFVFFTFNCIKSTELFRYNYGITDSNCIEPWLSEEKITLISDGDIRNLDLGIDECFSEGGWTCMREWVFDSGEYEPAANEFTSCSWDQSYCDCSGNLHFMDECIYSSDLGHYFMLEGCEIGLTFEQVVGIVLGSVVGGICLFCCVAIICLVLCIVVVCPVVVFGTTAGIYIKTNKKANNDKEVTSKGDLSIIDDIDKDVPAMVHVPTDNTRNLPAMVAFPNVLSNQDNNVEMVQMSINYNSNKGEEVSQKKMQNKDEEDKDLTSSDEELDY